MPFTTFNPVLRFTIFPPVHLQYLLNTNRFRFFFICLFDNHLSWAINRVLFTNFPLNCNKSTHLGPTTSTFLHFYYSLPEFWYWRSLVRELMSLACISCTYDASWMIGRWFHCSCKEWPGEEYIVSAHRAPNEQYTKTKLSWYYDDGDIKYYT